MQTYHFVLCDVTTSVEPTVAWTQFLHNVDRQPPKGRPCDGFRTHHLLPARANSGKWPANVEGERQVYTPHFRIVSRLDPLQHLPETEGGCLRQHLGWGLLTSNTFDRVEL